MHEAQYLDILVHVQKLKLMVAETPLSFTVRLQEVHTSEEMSIILTDNYHSTVPRSSCGLWSKWPTLIWQTRRQKVTTDNFQVE
jgi:hypothetical protein